MLKLPIDLLIDKSCLIHTHTHTHTFLLSTLLAKEWKKAVDPIVNFD